MLPYLEGERTPNLLDARGSVLGLTLANSTVANLARAMAEGMLCGLADGRAVQQIAPQIFGVPVIRQQYAAAQRTLGYA